MAKSANTTNPIPRKCSVEGCGERVRCKGLCKTHYERQRRWGRTHMVRAMAPKGSTEKWLREHAGHKGEDCLIWPYGRNALGYGIATIDGYCTLAHRLMCILVHGEPSFDGAEAAHYCGGGSDGCVNPDHVRWATRSINQQDKTLHGTHKSHSQRFSEAQVLEIYSDPRSKKEIAAEYGCGPSHVGQIKNGHKWAWLTGQRPVYPRKNPI